jgi:DNA-directed RNA polymerase specialized sigma24 family protein
MRGAAEVRHGYTLDHLHALAKIAVRRAWSRAADYTDRLDTAWYGITEHLCAAASPPQPWDLIEAGRSAVDQMIKDDLRQHGARRRDPYEGAQSARNYWRFWWDQATPVPSCENQVVDRHAFRQIWPLLSARHRQALAALAAYEDYPRAAAAMGITTGTFQVHISRARRAFLAHWHEGEKPSRVWGTDRRARATRTPGEQSSGRRRPPTRPVKRRRGRPEHQLVHGRASTYTNHGCRCASCTQAATVRAAAYRRARGARPRSLLTDAHRAEATRLRQAGRTWREIGIALDISQTSAIRAVNGRAPARPRRPE